LRALSASRISGQEREKIERQFLSIGQLLNYRALPRYQIGDGVKAWEDYRSWTDEHTLAEIILACEEILAKEVAVKERVREQSPLRQALARNRELMKQLQQEQARREELECQMQGSQPQPHAPDQLEKDLANVRVGMASTDLLNSLYGQVLLMVVEGERQISHLQTRIEKQYERRIAKQQARIAQLERLLVEYEQRV
jgi:hypothetical protein